MRIKVCFLCVSIMLCFCYSTAMAALPTYNVYPFDNAKELIEWINTVDIETIDEYIYDPDISHKSLINDIRKDGEILIPKYNGDYFPLRVKEGWHGISVWPELDSGQWRCIEYRMDREYSSVEVYIHRIDDEKINDAREDYLKYVTTRYTRLGIIGGRGNSRFKMVDRYDVLVNVERTDTNSPEDAYVGFDFASISFDKVKLSDFYDVVETYSFENSSVYQSAFVKFIPRTTRPEILPNQFEDVEGTDWFNNDVYYVHRRDLMNGTSTNPMLFSPNATLTRSMLVTILYRHTGEPNVSGLANPFADVDEKAWYTDPIKWAVDNRLVYGYNLPADQTSGGIFGAKDNITRQDLAVILLRYMNYLGYSPLVNDEWIIFADEADISAYAMDAIQTFNKLGIINGTDTNANGATIIDPQGNATRAQTAAILYRFLDYALRMN